MARVKRAVASKKHRRTVLERAKGYYGNKSRSYRAANEQVMHSLQYAYRDRRARKGDFRRLWIQRINAGCRQHGLSYNRFIDGLHTAGIEVDRKVLADLAVSDPAAFGALVDRAKAAVDEKAANARSKPVLTALSARHPQIQRLRRLARDRGARRGRAGVPDRGSRPRARGRAPRVGRSSASTWQRAPRSTSQAYP